MANKPLKSIKFPGLSDTYTVPEVDSTLTGSGKAADAKAVGDQLGDLKSTLDDMTIDPGDYWVTNLVPINGFVQGSLNDDGTITSSTMTHVTLEFHVEANKRYYIANNCYGLLMGNVVVLQTGAPVFKPTDTKRYTTSFSTGSVGGTCRAAFSINDGGNLAPDYAGLENIYAFEVVDKSTITDLDDLSQAYYSFSSQQEMSDTPKRVSYRFEAENGKAYSVTAPTGAVIREIILYNSEMKSHYQTETQTNTTLENSVIFMPTYSYLENPSIQILLANKTSANNNLSVSDCSGIVVKEVY